MPDYTEAVSEGAANLLSVLKLPNNAATMSAADLVLSSLTAFNQGANAVGSPCLVNDYLEELTFAMYFP